MVDVDFGIRVGDLLQVITVAGGGLVVFVQMRAESAANRVRLDKVDVELAKITGVLTQLAAGEARMNGLERRLVLLEDERRSAA